MLGRGNSFRITLCLLLVGCAPTRVGFQAVEREPVSPVRDAARISFSTDAGTHLALDISPDGATLVIDLLGKLWALPADGGTAEPLANTLAVAAEELTPIYSPDGQWIAFQGERNGAVGIWMVPADFGGEPELLAGTEVRGNRDTPPDWRADGRMVAFSVAGRLHIHDLVDGATQPVDLHDPEARRFEDPAWLPDGRLVATEAGTGSLWIVDLAPGRLTTLDTGGLRALAPAPSPDGDRVAYLSTDAEAGLQIWVQSLTDGADPVRLTDHEDVPRRRPRWSPDGEDLIYSADGGLWRVSSSGRGEASRRIPFTATVEIDRTDAELPPVRFPEPGADVHARGHMGLALSPDARRIAAIALGRLWVWEVDGQPRSIAEVPLTAEWLSWSPEGIEVAWSSGCCSEQDIFATHVDTGWTRRLTRLDGCEASRPAWSPDGRSIAFFLRRNPIAQPGECEAENLPRIEHPQRGRFAIIPAHADPVTDLTEVFVPAPDKLFSLPGFYVDGQERAGWARGSDALLLPPEREPVLILSLDGDAAPLRGVPEDATFLNWGADSTATFVRSNQLWRAVVRGDSLVDPVRLDEDAGLYPSVARDGSTLYVGEDGYRVQRPDGAIHRLGWPLAYRVPLPEPLLVREARIIDGTGGPPQERRDVLIEHGRIVEIAPGGSIGVRADIQVIEAEGRTLIPGLIDLHQHGWDDDLLVYAASLYHGVTTLREMGGPIARNAALAEAFAAGVFTGPRVVLGGFQLYPGSDLPPVAGASMQRPRTAEDAERALAMAQAFGASYVKMRQPGRWSAGAELVRLAHARGLRIGGHCAHPLPLISAGIAQVEHVVSCGPRGQAVYHDDMIRLFREADVAVVPTLVIMAGNIAILTRGPDLLGDPGIEPFLTPMLRAWGRYEAEDQLTDIVAGEDPFLQASKRRGGALHRAGVRIGTGTDIPMLPGAIHLEMEQFVRAGLTPLEAVNAATGGAARILGAEEDLGTIEEGKLADLVLLELGADPLEDIRDSRRIWRVIRGGHVVDPQDLVRQVMEMR